MKNIGYGAGTKEFDFPNVLRVIQFEVLDQQNGARPGTGHRMSN